MKRLITWPWSRDGAGQKNFEGFITEQTLHVAHLLSSDSSPGRLCLPFHATLVLDHVRSHHSVPPPCGMPRVVLASRCHWWSTGLWDRHSRLSRRRAVDLLTNKMANYLLIIQGTNANAQPKRPWASGFFFLNYFYLLLCQQYFAPGREYFQTSICLENEAAIFFSDTLWWLFWGRKKL